MAFIPDKCAERAYEYRAAARKRGVCALFGIGKGAGAAMLMAVLGVTGVAVCMIFGLLLKQ